MIAWWMALMRMVPKVKWMAHAAPRVFQAVSNMIMRSNNSILMDGIEGAYKIVRLIEAQGLEVAARSIFDNWEGVNWESGPMLAEAFAQFSEEIHSKLHRHVKNRLQSIESGKGLDFATAEASTRLFTAHNSSYLHCIYRE